MKGNKIESLDEKYDPEKLEKYLDWELSNIKACGSDEKIKHRIFAILDLGVELGLKEEDEQ